MSSEISPYKTNPTSALMTAQQFEELMVQAKCFASSDLVPKEFKDKPANVLIAMEMAARLGAGWFQVIQNLSVIQGRPSFSATFLMAMVNACGRFSPLEYRMEVTGEEKTVPIEYQVKEGFGQTAKYVTKKLNYTYTPTTCRAVAIDLRSGKEVVGPPVSYDLAISEGWVAKSGSKWQGEMRELMLTYRAGAFFSRVYASDLTLGMQTSEEIYDTIDVEARDVTPPKSDPVQQPDGKNPYRSESKPTAETTEEKPAPAKRNSPKSQTQSTTPPPAEASTEKGRFVTFDSIETMEGTNAKGSWCKFMVKYREADSDEVLQADTFSATMVAPLETAKQGDLIRIETQAASNPKYAPTLTFLEAITNQSTEEPKADLWD